MSASVWQQFTADPRDPAHAALRASDQDRAVVQELLGQAYADGRLDPDELERRSTALLASPTLGHLTPLIRDLVRPEADKDLHAVATSKYRRDVSEALGAFATANIICWTIWFVTGAEWMWPLIVTAATGMNLLRVWLERTSRVERHVRKLERKRHTELPGSDDWGGPDSSSR